MNITFKQSIEEIFDMDKNDLAFISLCVICFGIMIDTFLHLIGILTLTQGWLSVWSITKSCCMCLLTYCTYQRHQMVKAMDKFCSPELLTNMDQCSAKIQYMIDEINENPQIPK
mgnify:CR=1 FL=1